MSADEFTKLFNYIEKRFSELEAKLDARFDATDKRIDHLINVIDNLAKRVEINDEERIVMAHQLDGSTSGCIS